MEVRGLGHGSRTATEVRNGHCYAAIIFLDNDRHGEIWEFWWAFGLDLR